MPTKNDKKKEKMSQNLKKGQKRKTHLRISKKKEIKRRKKTNHCYINNFLAYIFFQGVPEKL